MLETSCAPKYYAPPPAHCTSHHAYNTQLTPHPEIKWAQQQLCFALAWVQTGSTQYNGIQGKSSKQGGNAYQASQSRHDTFGKHHMPAPPQYSLRQFSPAVERLQGHPVPLVCRL